MSQILVEKKYRKRNIHRQEPENKEELESSADSDNAFHLRTILPKPLRQCLSGMEDDRRQSSFITPTDETITLTKFDSSGDIDCSLPYTDIPNIKINKINCASACNVDSDDALSDADSPHNLSYTCTTVSSNTSNISDNLDSEYDYETSDKAYSFLTFRISYLFVTLVVMLADGLQGKN